MSYTLLQKLCFTSSTIVQRFSTWRIHAYILLLSESRDKVISYKIFSLLRPKLGQYTMHMHLHIQFTLLSIVLVHLLLCKISLFLFILDVYVFFYFIWCLLAIIYLSMNHYNLSLNCHYLHVYLLTTNYEVHA